VGAEGRKRRGGWKGGEGKGKRMWRGPESGLPRGPCWLSAGLLFMFLYRDGMSMAFMISPKKQLMHNVNPFAR